MQIILHISANFILLKLHHSTNFILPKLHHSANFVSLKLHHSANFGHTKSAPKDAFPIFICVYQKKAVPLYPQLNMNR